jgi:hypothetical protein
MDLPPVLLENIHTYLCMFMNNARSMTDYARSMTD